MGRGARQTARPEFHVREVKVRDQLLWVCVSEQRQEAARECLEERWRQPSSDSWPKIINTH